MVAELSNYASGITLPWAVASAVVGLAILVFIIVKLVREARGDQK